MTYDREIGSSRTETRLDGSVAQFSDPIEGQLDLVPTYVREQDVPDETLEDDLDVDSEVVEKSKK